VLASMRRRLLPISPDEVDVAGAKPAGDGLVAPWLTNHHALHQAVTEEL
jgi:hypothetical protein